MSMFRDREDDLSEIQRLVAKLAEPAGRRAFSADEWALAMAAHALRLSDDPDQPDAAALDLYAEFTQAAPAHTRRSSLERVAQFVAARRGAGWKSLLLYALGESHSPALSRRASLLALTLAPPEQDKRFTGAAALVHLMSTHTSATPAMLGALLSVSDLRLLPELAPLSRLTTARVEALLRGLETTLNSLSAACLQQLLEAHPELAEAVTQALLRLAADTPMVADLVYPMPTWAYENPAPQPLHAWELPEYLDRMRPWLTPHLTPEQMQRLQQAYA